LDCGLVWGFVEVNFYTATVEIPANTPEDKPVAVEVKVEGAVLKRISVLIPPGHCGLARLALARGFSADMF